MARPPVNIKSRDLRPLVPSNTAGWEEEIGKVGEEQKFIEVGDKSPKKFAKILARLQKGRFSA